MNITILDRDRNAPFDLFVENQKPVLIDDRMPKDLEKLTWENLDIKAYCLALTTQKNIKLEKILELPEYQKHARDTATLYLNEYSTSINKVYDQTWNFVRNFEIKAVRLATLARSIDEGESKESFKRSVESVINDIEKIVSACNELESDLPSLRNRFSQDSRNFQVLEEKATKLISKNKFDINSLKTKIATLTDRLDYLNKAIPGYASLTGLGALGIIIAAVVGTLMIVGSLGTATPAVVGGAIGLAGSAAALGVGGSKVYDFVKEQEEKTKELNEKNKELADLNAEVTIATNLCEKCVQWIKNLNSFNKQIQALYEGWNSIKNHFTNLMEAVSDSTKKRKDDLVETLDNTKKIVSEIRDSIKKHNQAGLISTRKVIDEEISRQLSLPTYFANPNSNLIILPSELFLDFSKKHTS